LDPESLPVGGVTHPLIFVGQDPPRWSSSKRREGTQLPPFCLRDSLGIGNKRGSLWTCEQNAQPFGAGPPLNNLSIGNRIHTGEILGQFGSWKQSSTSQFGSSASRLISQDEPTPHTTDCPRCDRMELEGVPSTSEFRGSQCVFKTHSAFKSYVGSPLG